MLSGRFGGSVVVRRETPGTPGTALNRFGVPYFPTGGISNVLAKVPMAPLPNKGHTKIGMGEPVFLYRPNKKMTGDDGTVTVYGLPAVNYGLHQRALYQELMDAKIDETKLSEEVIRYKEWPLTVDEFLQTKQIIPFGIRDTDPDDLRLERHLMVIPCLVQGRGYGVPWLWGHVRSGDTIGFRVGLCKPQDCLSVTPDGTSLLTVAKKPFLQLTPYILYSGTIYHGKGDNNNIIYELDYIQTVREEGRTRKLDAWGLPLGEYDDTAPSVPIEYETRGEGFFIRFGRVEMTMNPPTSKEGIKRALRTYDGMQKIRRDLRRVTVQLCPNPLVDEF